MCRRCFRRSYSTVYGGDDGTDDEERGSVIRDADPVDPKEKPLSVRLKRGCCGRTKDVSLIIWQYLCVAWVISTVAFFVAMVVLASTQRGMRAQNIISVLNLPDESGWDSLVSCAADDGCNVCGIGSMLGMQPVAHTSAIISPAGCGALWLRQLLTDGTGLKTTSDVCDVGVVKSTLPSFSCASPFVYAHSVATHFVDAAGVYRVPGYVAQRHVYVFRDPFRAAMRKFHVESACGSIYSSLMCKVIAVKASDYSGDAAWPAFALASASEWVRVWDMYESATVPKHVVYYEALLADRIATMRSLLTFIDGDGESVVPPSRGLACAVADSDTSLTEDGSLTIESVFTPALVRDMCAVLAPRWNATLWGSRCG